MKILVTGGAGFIASHVVDRMLAEGLEAVVVDNLRTGRRENLNAAAKFYEMSILDDALEDVFKSERIDYVDHHAAQMDVRKSTQDPVFDAQENIIGSIKLIENCVKYNVKRFVYASTGGAVYGEPEYLPVDEKHPINPLCQYGASKHTVEHYLRLYYQQHGLASVVLRYPNVYGPRQSPHGEAGVVAIFTGQILAGVRCTIFGDGSKTRDYTHVGDVVEANVLALTKGQDQVLNIGTAIETSDQEVYDAVAEALDSAARPKYAAVRPGEVNRICLDAALARRELGWAPKWTFREGIRNTVDHLRSDPYLVGAEAKRPKDQAQQDQVK